MCFLSIFWSFGHETCRIPSPQTGIEPIAPKSETVTTGAPRKSLYT